MRYSTQCVGCGEFVLLVAPIVYAGWYPCPVCGDGSLIVPETALTPRDDDAFSIDVGYEVLHDGREW